MNLDFQLLYPPAVMNTYRQTSKAPFITLEVFIFFLFCFVLLKNVAEYIVIYSMDHVMPLLNNWVLDVIVLLV